MIIFRILTLILILLTGTSCNNSANDVPEGMVLVPAGEFIMGTNDTDEKNKAEIYGIPDKWFIDEQPEKKIYLDTYYIDKYEVTMEKYKKFIDATGHRSPGNWNETNFPSGMANYPVVLVTLYDALDYAKWAGKRIPTEAEWEKAARGTDGRIYPWGNKFEPEKANISMSMNKKTSVMPVGSYKEGVSPYGVYDMTGNVWEFTVNWYKPYAGNTTKKERFGKKYIVTRGFSFFGIGHFPDNIYKGIIEHLTRSSYRDETLPNAINVDVGFRCVKDF